MEKRVLGRTGARLSVIGLGGLVVSGVSPADATEYVTRAIGRGVNYFDVAPTYGDAEQRLGAALEPYRDQVFLACKTTQLSAKDVETELNNSLEQLRTDHFDLYQLHAVNTSEQVDQILSPGGALEAFIAARDRGLIKHIGFSAHAEDSALRLLDAFPFDSVLFPVNLFCWRDGFGPRVCEKAAEKGTGILAIKALAKRHLHEDEKSKWSSFGYVPIDSPPEVRTAISFTLSKPVTSAVCPRRAELLWLACDAVDALENDPSAVSPQETLHGEPYFKTPE